jgi:hypothetical protein
VEGVATPDARVRLPLSMLNRHGLVAGATGTGKTKTLQLMADLFADLPEVGDVEQPRLVFSLDEAHLLFDDAPRPSSRRDRAPFASSGPRASASSSSPRRRRTCRRRCWRSSVTACSARFALSPRTTRGPHGDRQHVPPQRGLRPARAAHPDGHRRGRGDAAVRARHADAGGLDAAAATRLAHGPAGPGRARAPRAGLPAAGGTAPPSTATRRTSGCWRRSPPSRSRSPRRGAGVPPSAAAARSPTSRVLCSRSSRAACSAASRARRPVLPGARSRGRCSAPRPGGGHGRGGGVTAPPAPGSAPRATPIRRHLGTRPQRPGHPAETRPA